MDLRDLQTLVDYHYWARDRILEAVEQLPPDQFTRPLGNSFTSLRDTVAHLYGADWIWMSRWDGESPRALPDTAAFPDVASIREAWRVEERRIRALLERLGDAGVQQPMIYRRGDEPPQSQPFWQMLQHLVNHGTYHRGQVTTLLRQLGAAPPKSTDLITFFRERAAAAMA
jgi:uncharacterized damage-inducible protein DinB